MPISFFFLYFQTKDDLITLFTKNNITTEFSENFGEETKYSVLNIKVSYGCFASEAFRLDLWNHFEEMATASKDTGNVNVKMQLVHLFTLLCSSFLYSACSSFRDPRHSQPSEGKMFSFCLTSNSKFIFALYYVIRIPWPLFLRSNLLLCYLFTVKFR